jgi:outer membrane receptor protein involved in Fe transport
MWAQKFSGNPSFVGNPNLVPERFAGVDLIYSYEVKRWRASADAFYTRVKDLITSVGANYANQGASMYEGLELDGQYSVSKPVRLNAGYSYIDPVRSETSASFLTDGKITDVPTHTLRYGVDVKPIESVTMSLTGRTYTETKVADPITGNTTLPPVTVLDASIKYTIQAWDLQVLVKNLTNNSYELGGTVIRPLARQGIDVEGIVGYKF